MMATETMTIGIDPEYDLNEAGYSRDEADSLYAAWSKALAEIADERGMDLRPRRTSHESQDWYDHCARGEEACAIWQEAHDRIARQADGTWTARESNGKGR